MIKPLENYYLKQKAKESAFKRVQQEQKKRMDKFNKFNPGKMVDIKSAEEKIENQVVKKEQVDIEIKESNEKMEEGNKQGGENGKT